MKARLADLGGTVLRGSPSDFGKLIADEAEKWHQVCWPQARLAEHGLQHSITSVPRTADPLDEGGQISSNFLHCICRLLAHLRHNKTAIDFRFQ